MILEQLGIYRIEYRYPGGNPENGPAELHIRYNVWKQGVWLGISDAKQCIAGYKELLRRNERDAMRAYRDRRMGCFNILHQCAGKDRLSMAFYQSLLRKMQDYYRYEIKN